MGMGFPFGNALELDVVVTQHNKYADTELFILKWILAFYKNLTSIK